MDPISALIGAGSSVFGSVLGNIFGSNNVDKTNQQNYQIAQMNNQFNEQMLEKQMRYNEDMWNKQNAYNDPSAQRARLEAAGINPYLAMSGGNSSGVASSAMGVNPPTAQGVQMQAYKPDLDFSGFNQAAQMLYEKKKMDTDIAKSNEEKRGLELQNERQWIANMFAMQEHISNLANSGMDYKTKQKNLGLMEQQLVNMGYEGELYQAQRRFYDQQTEGIELENTYKTIRNEKAPEMFKLEIAQRANDILYKQAQTNMTNTQAAHEIEKMIETQARAAGLRYDNAVSAQTIAARIIEANERAKRSSQPNNMFQFTHDYGTAIRDKLDSLYEFGKDSWKKFKREFRIPGIF